MRVIASISIILALFTTSCELWEDEPPVFTFNSVKNVFEGQWEWVETNGIGFDGLPFTRTPVSEGYTWKYVFFDPHCFSGKLQTYKNEIAELFYIYTYTISTDPLNQVIELDRLGNNIPERLYWKIEKLNGDEHLLLEDPNYTPIGDQACQANIEHHFIRISDSGRCSLIPDPGPCDAAIPKYFYNPVTGLCEQFIWGGCGGVVPFQTLQECIQCIHQ
jgi:hypothetical protein